MANLTTSVIAILLARFADVASAQVNCEAIPHGPARTDCYLGLSQFYRGQSDFTAPRPRHPLLSRLGSSAEVFFRSSPYPRTGPILSLNRTQRRVILPTTKS